MTEPLENDAEGIALAAHKRTAFGSGPVYGVLVALLIVVLSVFGIGYYRIVHYRPRLLQYVPSSASVALRVNLQQAVLFEPVRRYLFPLVERSPLGSDALSRLQTSSGVNLSMDLRELLIAISKDGEWLFGFGGSYNSGALFEALSAALLEKPQAGCRREEARLIVCKAVVIARAADDVLLVGSSRRDVTDAASQTARGLQLRLVNSAALSFGALLPAGAGESTTAPFAHLRGAGLTRLFGSVEPANPLSAELRLQPAIAGSVADNLASADHLALLKADVSEFPLPLHELALKALMDAQPQTAGQTPHLVLSFPRELLFEAAERFNGWFSLQVGAAAQAAAAN